MNWLVASRRFVYTHENQQKHNWAKNVDFMNTVHDQVGRKVGILGYGSIGRQSISFSPYKFPCILVSKKKH